MQAIISDPSFHGRKEGEREKGGSKKERGREREKSNCATVTLLSIILETRQ